VESLIAVNPNVVSPRPDFGRYTVLIVKPSQALEKGILVGGDAVHTLCSYIER